MRHEVGSRDVEVEAQRAEVFRRFELAKPLPSVDDLLAMQREFPALSVEIAGMANAKAASLMAILRGEVDDFQPDPAWRAGVRGRARELLRSLRRAEGGVGEDDGAGAAGPVDDRSTHPAAGVDGTTPGIAPGWPPRLRLVSGGRADAGVGIPAGPGREAGVTRRADAPTLRLVGRDRRAGAGDDPSEGPTTGS